LQSYCTSKKGTIFCPTVYVGLGYRQPELYLLFNVRTLGDRQADGQPDSEKQPRRTHCEYYQRQKNNPVTHITSRNNMLLTCYCNSFICRM